MRVLALGGAGEMGTQACRVAVELANVTELVVADRDLPRANRLAASLGPTARSMPVEAIDPESLRQAMAGVDIVMNTVGPFFRHAVPVVTAAIDSGCSYIDICDDWEPLPQIYALDAEARDAGVTVLVGMGASPGITNLLAVLATRQLDSVEEITTGWNLEGATSAGEPGRPPSAAIMHGIRQITGTIQVTDAGRSTFERPLQPVRLDYPGAARRRKAWTFGHPEAVTLPRTYAEVTSRNVTFGGPGLLMALRTIGRAVDRKLITPDRAARLIARAERLVPTEFQRILRRDLLPPLFALATGARADGPASVGCALVQLPGTTMGELTGIPLGVALGMLPGSPCGVYAPEALLNPDTFFTALAPHCLGTPAPADMILTTSSWSDRSATDLHRAIAAARQKVEHDKATSPSRP